MTEEGSGPCQQPLLRLPGFSLYKEKKSLIYYLFSSGSDRIVIRNTT